jgi:hypothetical protein
MVCLTAKDAWRTLRNEEVTSISYNGFLKWVHGMNIDLAPGIGADVLAVLRNYAQVRSKAAKQRTNQNGSNKLEVLKAIANRSTVKGSELIDLCESKNALSRCTLYRRATTVLGQDFSATTEYTREQVRLLIFGV